MTFIDKEEKEHTVQAPIGKHLLEVAHDNEIDLEGEIARLEVGRRVSLTLCPAQDAARPHAPQGRARGPWPAPPVT